MASFNYKSLFIHEIIIFLNFFQKTIDALYFL